MIADNIFSLKTLKEKYEYIYVYGAGKYAHILLEIWGGDCNCIEAVVVSDSSENVKEINVGKICVPVFVIEEVLENITKKTLFVFAMAENTANSIISQNELLRRCEHIVISEKIYERILVKKNNLDCLEYYRKLNENSISFKYVEIETVNRCNGICEFCAVNANAPQRPYKKMSTEMFESIICQLEQMNYDKQVALFSNNEPFLDNRMLDFAVYAREHLPNAYIYLFTNGKLLSLSLYKEIMKYLDYMQIDMYQEETDDVEANIKEIMEYSDLNCLNNCTRFVKISPRAIRYSRGGSSPNSKVDVSIDEICRLPLVQLVIRPDGKISLCCNDALGQMTIGDLRKESIMEAWNGDKRKCVQKLIVEGRESIPICKFCNSIDRRDFDGKPYM